MQKQILKTNKTNSLPIGMAFTKNRTWTENQWIYVKSIFSLLIKETRISQVTGLEVVASTDVLLNSNNDYLKKQFRNDFKLGEQNKSTHRQLTLSST